MSKQRTVTKKQIIQALKTENLNTGMWENSVNCTVCAVGAVLRQCNISPFDYVGSVMRHAYLDSYYTNAQESVEKHIAANQWASALSCYFEDVACGNREMTIAFVKERFPNKLLLAKGW